MEYDKIIKELEQNVKEEILQPWLKVVSLEEGKIHSSADREWNLSDKEPLSSVLLARILWTYSRASRIYGDSSYRKAADLAFLTLKNHFYDKEEGGYFWSVQVDGEVKDSRKHIYSQSFILYGLSEYGRINHDKGVLKDCRDLFTLLMKYGWDREYGGFIECRGRNWEPLEDQRLSIKDLNVDKSMNTNLHAMEALSNYLELDSSKPIIGALIETVEVILNRIVDPDSGHFSLFFNRDWSVVGRDVSYGHDIEGAWLIWESLEKISPSAIAPSIREKVLKLIETTRKKGIDPVFGGCFYEGSQSEVLQKNKDWWPQAEAMVGFLQGYLLQENPEYLDIVEKTWNFIQNNLVDKKYRGWYWSCEEGGVPLQLDKAGPWQCPYHNARGCWESIDRIRKIKELKSHV